MFLIIAAVLCIILSIVASIIYFYNQDPSPSANTAPAPAPAPARAPSGTSPVASKVVAAIKSSDEKDEDDEEDADEEDEDADEEETEDAEDAEDAEDEEDEEDAATDNYRAINDKSWGETSLQSWSSMEPSASSNASVVRDPTGGAMINSMDSLCKLFAVTKVVQQADDAKSKCKPVCDSMAKCIGFMHDVTRKRCFMMEASGAGADAKLSIKSADKSPYKVWDSTNPKMQLPISLPIADCKTQCDANNNCMGFAQQGTKCAELPPLVATPGVNTYLKL